MEKQVNAENFARRNDHPCSNGEQEDDKITIHTAMLLHIECEVTFCATLYIKCFSLSSVHVSISGVVTGQS